MRHWEIDFSRGILVLLMLLFNWSYALAFLNIYEISQSFVYWMIFPRFIGAGFIFIAGLSFSISYSKNQSWKKHAKRGALLLGLGMLITLATFIAFPGYTILFGILHLIGLSIIIGLALMRYRKWFMAAGIVIIIAGFVLGMMQFKTPYLLWLGFMPEGFTTFDYFPLLPWTGFFLVGMAVRVKKARIGPKLARPVQFIGRHSLIIYIFHQPVLLLFLYALHAL